MSTWAICEQVAHERAHFEEQEADMAADFAPNWAGASIWAGFLQVCARLSWNLLRINPHISIRVYFIEQPSIIVMIRFRRLWLCGDADDGGGGGENDHLFYSDILTMQLMISVG